ncbi:MAG: hypothetical protein LUH54_00760, partial [Firmicutes bacterium]|nr:hypothetical protein [Bacillota bacterium]
MKMKKIMCALLALLMVIVPLALAACQDTADDGTTTTAAGDGTGDTQAGDDTGDSAEAETFDIAENDLYSGRTFTILCHTDLTYNYGTTDFDEPSDDAREQALYDRGIAVEELLGVTVDMYQDDLGADIYSLMKTDVDSGTTNYDIVFNNMPYSCTATGAGYCLNIDEISYIDLSTSWWNADCTEQLALIGDHYMVSGDIAVSDKEC